MLARDQRGVWDEGDGEEDDVECGDEASHCLVVWQPFDIVAAAGVVVVVVLNICGVDIYSERREVLVVLLSSHADAACFVSRGQESPYIGKSSAIAERPGPLTSTVSRSPRDRICTANRQLSTGTREAQQMTIPSRRLSTGNSC